MAKRPNIIIFNPDQMRADSLAHLGNPASITPFLDDFAQNEGVSFRNAFCQNPVCVPSRCSFTTGLYPHVHGHRTMSYLLREGEASIFSELKDAGYHVWMNARNDLVAGQNPELLQQHASEIFYGGDSPDPPGPLENIRGGPGCKNFYSMFFGKLGVDDSGRYYGSDDEDIDAAIDRIRNPIDDKPLCIFLGLVNPHPPYMVEDPYYSTIDRAKLTKRIAPDVDTGKPLLQQLIRENQAMQEYTENDWDELRACYLGMCMKVDELFRRFCDALRKAGEYDNSAIFFFSDHGDYTGDHGISEKAQNCFEDCLTNVPLLIKPPKGIKLDSGIADGLTELIDFYATAMDFAGVEPEHTHFGHSLRAVLANRSNTVREYVCCEGGRLAREHHADEFHSFGEAGVHKFNPYWPRLAAQANSTAHGKAVMLRTSKYKYVSRLYEQDEFYDLIADPQEHHNCIDEPQYALDIMYHREMLMRWYLETADVVPFNLDERTTEEMVWAKVKKYVPLSQEQSIRERIRNGANQYELINECRAAYKQHQ